MADENTTEPTSEGAQAMLDEIDRLKGELAKANGAELITPEEHQRRLGDELLRIALGPNTGAGTAR